MSSSPCPAAARRPHLQPPAPSFLSNPAARLLPYIALMAFSNYVCMASQFSLYRFVGCKDHWSKAHPPRVPLPDDEMCDIPSVAAMAGSIIAVVAVVSSSTGLLVTAPVQRLTDRVGRKAMLVGLPLLDLTYLIFLVLGFDSNNIKISYPLLLFANIINAVSAKSWAFLPSLVISDVATVEQRTPWFARLQAANLASAALAFLCSSLLASHVPYKYSPYAAAALVDILAALWALFGIPETRVRKVVAVEDQRDGNRGFWTRVGTAIISPIKPLRLLLPQSREKGGSWNMMLLGSTAFVAVVGQTFPYTALVLYLQDRFRFSTSANGYVLTYMQGARVFVLALVFPFVLKTGRRAFHRWQLRHPLHVLSDRVGTVPITEDERTSLLADEEPTQPGEVLVISDPAAIANHFDVILSILSLSFDLFGYLGVFFSSSWQQVIGCFTVLAFASSFTSTLRSTFLAAVEPAQASESMAAFSILNDISSILSSIVMGALFAWFTNAGRSELLFVVTSALCGVAASFLFFVRRI